MKKAFLTAFIMFVAAFLLLFSFQKDKNRINTSGKKIYTSKAAIIKSPEKTDKAAPQEMTHALAQTATEQTPQQVTNETLDTFFNEMPRTDQLQSNSGDQLHGTPQAVLNAGEKLGEIHEYLINHPQSRDIEMSFYLKCSQQKDFFDSIRAVCAARLSQQYFEATGHEISSEIFDKNIDQLRREINL